MQYQNYNVKNITELNPMAIDARLPLVKKDFAQRLKNARLNHVRRYKKTDIARILDIGRNTYGRWEDPNDPALPSDLVKFNHLCELLNVSAGFLMNGTREMEIDIATEHRDFMKQFYTRYRMNPSYLAFVQFSMEFDDDIIARYEENWWALRAMFRNPKRD